MISVCTPIGDLEFTSHIGQSPYVMVTPEDVLDNRLYTIAPVHFTQIAA
jgi:hypothetical protein